MSHKLRIVVGAAPSGPWSALADRLEAAGAEILRLGPDAQPSDLPAGWFPDGLVATPVEHQRARFDRIDLDRWEADADEELNARFRLGQLVARRMLEGNGGSIVHVVPAQGLPGAPQQGEAAILGYAAAGLSRGIALDLRDKVRANTLALEPDAGSLEAAAALILLLCGPKGRGISGQIAAIDAAELHLFAQSRPLRVAHRDGGWDEPSLAAQVARWSAYLPGLAAGGEARQ